MSALTQNGVLKRDDNDSPVMGGTSSSDNATIINAAFDPVTRRLLTDASGGGSGTVTEVDTGTGLTGGPITTTGTIALDSKLAPLDTLGTAGQLIRVNAGATALEYFTSASSGLVIGTTTITSGTATRILYDNAGVLGEYTLTGSGTVVVMATSPTLVTPVLGVATATSINKVALTAPATGSTLTIADGKTLTANSSLTLAGTDGKTLTVSNSGTLAGGDAFTLAIAASKTLTVSNTLTFTGTDGSSVAFGTGGTVLYTSSTVPLTVGTTTIASGTNTRILYDNSGVLGEYTLTGTGTVVVMATSPSLVTPLLGTPTSGTLTNCTGLPIAGLVSSTSTALGVGSIELGNASDTTLSRSSGGVLAVEGVVIPSISSTNTLTNKRMTRRIVTVSAPGATPTTNSDNNDIANFTGLGTAITSMTTNLSGTPADGDLLEFRFIDDGTARGITWGTSFASTTISLPTTTVISTCLRVLVEWRAASSKWECLATC